MLVLSLLAQLRTYCQKYLSAHQESYLLSEDLRLHPSFLDQINDRLSRVLFHALLVAFCLLQDEMTDHCRAETVGIVNHEANNLVFLHCIIDSFAAYLRDVVECFLILADAGKCRILYHL